MMKNTILAAAALLLALGGAAQAETAGRYIDDSAITTKVKAALLTDSALKSTDIDVKTNQGVVTLQGNVNTLAQSRLAAVDASKVSGVKSVTNNLNVAGHS